MGLLAAAQPPTLVDVFWASAVVAAIVSGIVSLITAWVSARLQETREASAWRRSTRVDVYVAALDSFQRVITEAMKLALELYVWKVAKAAAGNPDAAEPDRIDGLGSKLVDAEERFVVARTQAVVVGSPEVVAILEQMSSIVFEAGSDARQGSDTGTERWHERRAQANRLRLAFANEARRSLGFENLPDWPSFNDLSADSD